MLVCDQMCRLYIGKYALGVGSEGGEISADIILDGGAYDKGAIEKERTV